MGVSTIPGKTINDPSWKVKASVNGLSKGSSREASDFIRGAALHVARSRLRLMAGRLPLASSEATACARASSRMVRSAFSGISWSPATAVSKSTGSYVASRLMSSDN